MSSSGIDIGRLEWGEDTTLTKKKQIIRNINNLNIYKF